MVSDVAAVSENLSNHSILVVTGLPAPLNLQTDTHIPPAKEKFNVT